MTAHADPLLTFPCWTYCRFLVVLAVLAWKLKVKVTFVRLRTNFNTISTL